MSSFPSSPSPAMLLQHQGPHNTPNTTTTPPGPGYLPQGGMSQQQQALSSMPPPSAPASKPTDPTDLADALTSAGIDLKEEEARLAIYPGSRTGGPLPEDEAIRIVQRRHAESRANHLSNPFLETPVLSNRLRRKTQDTQCQPFTLNAGNGQQATGAHADIIALLSLGARERVNQIVTRAVVLARARRKGTNVVAGDWASAVKGATPDNGPGSAISPHANPLKRSFSTAGDLLQVPLATTTTTLPNETAKALRALQQREYQKEQERLAKKAKREGGNLGAGAGLGGSTGSMPSTPATGGGFGDSNPPTPGADGVVGGGGGGGGERRISARESKKQRESKLDEANTHRAANATANMMMMSSAFGGRKRKKTYSWMSAAGGAGAGALPMAPRGVAGSMAGPDLGASGGTVDSGIGMAGGAQGHWVGGQRIGAWREDGEKGLGIQMRDWVGALEGDGRGVKRGLIKAYLKMK